MLKIIIFEHKIVLLLIFVLIKKEKIKYLQRLMFELIYKHNTNIIFKKMIANFAKKVNAINIINTNEFLNSFKTSI